MSVLDAHRWGARILLLGCLLLGVGSLIRMVASSDVTDQLQATSWSVQAPGGVLALIGFPIIYTQRATQLGILGFLAYIALMVFLAIFGVFASLLHGLVLPSVELQAPGVVEPTSVLLVMPFGAIMGMLGAIALGIASWRAGGLPRSGGVLMILGGFGLFLGHGMPLHVGDASLVVFLIGLGWWTAGQGGRVVAESAPHPARD